MTEKQFRFWQKWLTYANVMSVGVGLLCAFAGNSFFFLIDSILQEGSPTNRLTK